MHRRSRWLALQLLLVPGALLLGSCLAGVQQNLDVLFSPTAIDNRLIAPYVGASGLLQFLIKLFKL